MRSRVLCVSSVLAAMLTGATFAHAESQNGVFTHDLSRCDAGAAGSALLVRVEAMRDTDGNVRAEIYSSNPAEFLEKGKKLVRVEVPAMGDGQTICVPLPSSGRYALVLMHDRNANGKPDFFSEGFGFSNNPKLALGPPSAEEVMFDAPEGVLQMTLSLTYIFGQDEEQKKKRRQIRR